MGWLLYVIGFIIVFTLVYVWNIANAQSVSGNSDNIVSLPWGLFLSLMSWGSIVFFLVVIVIGSTIYFFTETEWVQSLNDKFTGVKEKKVPTPPSGRTGP